MLKLLAKVSLASNVTARFFRGDLGCLLVIVSVQRGEKPCKCFAVMQSFDNNTINYEMPKHSEALSGVSFRDFKKLL